MNKSFLMAIAAAATTICGGASAQTAEDVVVMRRAITRPTLDDNAWKAGDWLVPRQCSDTATYTRDVHCEHVSDHVTVDASNCRGAKPDTTMVSKDYSGCSFRWATSEGTYDSMCADSTVKRFDVSCIRTGPGTPANGTATADETGCLAVQPRPATTAPVSIYTGCSFNWVATTGSCVTVGRRANNSTCQRSGGTSATTTVTSGCNDATKPATTVADASCTATSNTCTLQQGVIATAYGNDVQLTASTRITSTNPSAATVAFETKKFCEARSWAKSCEGYVEPYAPNTITIYVTDQPATYGAANGSSYRQAASGNCMPTL